MARLCICSGTTSGPCVTVVDGTEAGAPASGHFFPADHTGNVGDTWTGSTWDRLAAPSAESEWSNRYTADHDAGELHEVIGNTIVARRSAGAALEGLSSALSGALAGKRSIGVEGDTTALALAGFGATAAHAPGLAFGRSSGALGALATLDGDYVLGRVGFWGAVHGGTFGEAGAFEMIRTGGGLTEGSPLTARARVMMRDVGGSRFEALSLTHEGRLGLGAATPSAMLEARAPTGVSALALAFSGGAIHTRVDDEGRLIVGHGVTLEVGGDEPHVQVWSDTPPPARFARAADDAVGALLQLYKTRGGVLATADTLEAGVAEEDDEIGGFEALAPSEEGAVATFGRVLVRRSPGTATAGAVTFETLAEGALREVARFAETGYLGLGTETPAERLHVYDTTPTNNTIHALVRVESFLTDFNPLTDEDPAVGYGSGIDYWASGPDGQVAAAAIEARITDVTSGADKWEWRVRTRSNGALVQGLTVGQGQALIEGGTAAAPGMAFRVDVDTGVWRKTTNVLGLAAGGVDVAAVGSTYFRPTPDNTIALGGTSNRWSVVYAGTGTINTSDQREKFDLGPIPLGLDFIAALQPRWFRWLEGSRRHAGLYAQEVAAALAAAGVDPATAGMWILGEPDDPASRQGLRMDQFIPPLIRAVQQLTARVAALEA